MNLIDLFATGALLNGIVSIIFGALVIIKNWRDRLNQFFFLMAISLAVWSFGYWQWQLSNDYDTALMWVRILSIGSLFVPIFFYNWVIRLLDINTIFNKAISWFTGFVVVIILCFTKTNLFIFGLEKESIFMFWPKSGVAYDIYFSYIYLGLITYSIYLLFRTYSTNNCNLYYTTS